MQSTCVACHASGQLAGGTALLFVSGGTTVQNYNRLRNYAKTRSALLLSKSIGQPSHAGGSPFGSSASTEYKNLAALVPVMQGACPSTSPPPPPPSSSGFWGGVSLASDATTLARAAILFASRNPTAAEYQAVASGGASALRSTIRAYMQGSAFDAFLDETGDTVFLPQGVFVQEIGDGLANEDFPSLANFFNSLRSGTGVDATLRTQFITSIKREGVELLKYIVKNDKPWTDMVQGNYTVMNGMIASRLAASVDGTFTNPNDPNEWRTGKWKSERLGGVREHAGVLSTHAWLNRFPTTDTNRNRHRALMVARQFLGFDINALAARPIDDSGKAFRVPTLENPTCTACHDTMDPIAGGFQNWDTRGRFLPIQNFGNTALPYSYMSSTYPKRADGQPYYVKGDNWFRDSVAPGFNGVVMPNGFTGNDTALQWLGQKIAADKRFPMGAVHFWYRALFGREPLATPLNPASPQYAGLLAAYNAQNAEFSEIATRFANNQGHGAFNVRDLLTDLVLSKWFRAESATGLTADRAIQLGDLNSSNLLIPEQLQRKLRALIGMGYSGFINPHQGRGLIYGNFDGDANAVRTKAYTILQTSVVDNIAASISCPAVQTDFGKAIASRLLFPSVSMNDTPQTTAGQQAIVQNIRYLHKWLLKEDLPANHPEIQRTYGLFMAVWNDRATAPSRSTTCSYTATNDPNYTGRTWSAVLAYLIGDPKFIFE